MAKQLSAEQTIAIEWLSKPKKGGKTFEEIADLCGVHPNTIGNWRKDKFFDAELKRAIIRENSDRLPELVASLTDIAIRDGNAAMAKLALQVNDMLTDRLEVETKDSGDADIDAIKAKVAAYKERNRSADSQ